VLRVSPPRQHRERDGGSYQRHRRDAEDCAAANPPAPSRARRVIVRSARLCSEQAGTPGRTWSGPPSARHGRPSPQCVGRAVTDPWVLSAVATADDLRVLMTRCTESMVVDTVQTFWAAMHRGQFVTDAAAEAGTYRKQDTRWVAVNAGVPPQVTAVGGVEMTTGVPDEAAYCCLMMARQLTQRRGQHASPWDCPDGWSSCSPTGRTVCRCERVGTRPLPAPSPCGTARGARSHCPVTRATSPGSGPGAAGQGNDARRDRPMGRALAQRCWWRLRAA
jgi:hypothetical protein